MIILSFIGLAAHSTLPIGRIMGPRPESTDSGPGRAEETFIATGSSRGMTSAIPDRLTCFESGCLPPENQRFRHFELKRAAARNFCLRRKKALRHRPKGCFLTKLGATRLVLKRWSAVFSRPPRILGHDPVFGGSSGAHIGAYSIAADADANSATNRFGRRTSQRTPGSVPPTGAAPPGGAEPSDKTSRSQSREAKSGPGTGLGSGRWGNALKNSRQRIGIIRR